jgi:hypothetical protein
MHCFLFFGFPGEREDDAQQTYDFIMGNADVIGSFGCGTFALEHNAPIQRHLEKFDVRVGQAGLGDLDVYYTYEVANGVGPDRAMEWANALNTRAFDVRKYAAASWIPREHLLCLLSRSSPQELVESGSRLLDDGFIPLDLPSSDIFSIVCPESIVTTAVLINRVAGGFFRLPSKLVPMFRMLCESKITLRELRQINAPLFTRITGRFNALSTDERHGEVCAEAAECDPTLGEAASMIEAHRDRGQASIAALSADLLTEVPVPYPA